jgi:hypothetical protein
MPVSLKRVLKFDQGNLIEAHLSPDDLGDAAFFVLDRI